MTILKKILRDACCLFTVFTLLYMIILLILLEPESGFVPSEKTVLLFFPCSLCMAFGNTYLSKKKIIVHAILYFVGIYGFVCLPHAIGLSGSTYIILAVLYILVYGISMAFYCIILSKYHKKQEKNTEYVNVYKTSNKK